MQQALALHSVAGLGAWRAAHQANLISRTALTELAGEETSRLLRMEDELHMRIVGQEEAVKAVTKAIRRTRAG